MFSPATSSKNRSSRRLRDGAGPGSRGHRAGEALRSFKGLRLVLVAASVAALPGTLDLAQAQVEKSWVATYDGPGQGMDRPRALAVDREGSVLVAGDSVATSGAPRRIVTTVKYRSDGRALWVASYRSPGGDSFSSGLAVDALGNAHVIAKAVTDGSTGSDYTTVKYSPDGKELWVRAYNGPRSEADVPAGIGIDAAGNVYVTGPSYTTAITGIDYATVKYAPDGREVWVQRWNAPDSGSDEPCAIAVDPQGNAHVTGRSAGTDTKWDYATVKYAPDGQELWARRWNGFDNLDDAPAGIAVDPGGNVYIVGASATVIGTGSDFATVKYSPAGEELWVEYYGESGAGGDWPTGIATDLEGNVYVTGMSFGVGDTDFDYLTLKYTTHGEALWIQVYDGPESGEDTPRGIAVLADGSVVVTGSSSGGPETKLDYATVKYAASGKELWVHRWAGPGAGYDSPCGVALDAAGGAIVAGTSASSDYATLKLDPDGNLLWVRMYSAPGSMDEEATALALGPGGRVVATGKSEGGATRLDFATVQYDSDGKQLWAERYDGPGNASDVPSGLAVDAAGDVHVTGESWGASGTGLDYATVKYSPDGMQLWAVRYDGPGSGNDKPSGIAVGAAGDVLVTGESEGETASSTDYATVKYAADGKELWVRRWSGPGARRDGARGIALDAAGNACVAGESFGSADTDSDWATIKYSPAGTELWARRWSGPGSAADRPAGIAVDAAGNAVITGNSSGGARTRLDYSTVKYAPDGTELWARRYDGPGNKDDKPFGIALDSAGNAYVTGESRGLPDTGIDCATVKYDPDGNEIWVQRHVAEGQINDLAEGIALDAAGNVLVAVEQRIASLYTLHTIAMLDPQGNVLWTRSQAPSIRAIRADARGAVYVAGRRGNDYAAIKYEPLPLKRGDVDADGKTVITDAVVLLQHLFLGGSVPPCLDAADTDDNGHVNVSDAIRLLGHLFLGRIPPEEPFAHCGRDPTLDSIDCKAFKPCDPQGGIPAVSFYGEEFRADGIFWVVDKSAHMAAELEIAKRELALAIAALPESAEFGIVFFDLLASQFPESSVPARATAEMKAGATIFVQAATADGWGGCAQRGLAQGLQVANQSTSERKALIYVGSGRGECQGADEATYLRQTLQATTTANVQGIPIHCIGVADPWPINEDFLRSLAEASEGTYTRIFR